MSISILFNSKNRARLLAYYTFITLLPAMTLTNSIRRFFVTTQLRLSMASVWLLSLSLFASGTAVAARSSPIEASAQRSFIGESEPPRPSRRRPSPLRATPRSRDDEGRLPFASSKALRRTVFIFGREAGLPAFAEFGAALKPPRPASSTYTAAAPR